jgi:hypothetical protein
MNNVASKLNDLSFCINHPLAVVQYFFERLVQENGLKEDLLVGDWGVTKYFEDILRDEKNYYQVLFHVNCVQFFLIFFLTFFLGRSLLSTKLPSNTFHPTVW